METSLRAVIEAALQDDKAEELVHIDLAGKSLIADAMLVCSGTSRRHVVTLAESVAQAVKDAGHGPARLEGLEQGEWVCVDAGDVIVHVFQPEVRAFYNLEKMWEVAPASVPEEA